MDGKEVTGRMLNRDRKHSCNECGNGCYLVSDPHFDFVSSCCLAGYEYTDDSGKIVTVNDDIRPL